MRRVAMLLLLAVGLAAVGVLVMSHDGCTAQDREAISSAASARHWAGTDDLGRDRAARLAAAALLGFAGAAAVSLVTTLIAVLVGVGGAFAPVAVGKLLLYASDLFLTLPWLFLLMLARSMLPLNLPAYTSAGMTLLLLAGLGWPIYVRAVYRRAARLRGSGWMLQARATGCSGGRMVRAHVMPHLRPIYLTQFLLCVPAAIIAEANLGTLGLGMSDPLVSWGSLLGELGSSAQLATTHWVFLPLALLVAVLLCMDVLIPENR